MQTGRPACHPVFVFIFLIKTFNVKKIGKLSKVHKIKQRLWRVE